MKKTEKSDRKQEARFTDKRTLGDPKEIAPKFLQLARDIVSASHSRGSSRISHEECRALLDLCVDSEKRGENARALYPNVFKHLQFCKSCRLLHDSLKEALAEVGPSRVVRSSERKTELSFLGQTRPPAALDKYVRSRIAGGPLGFGYTIDPKKIARLFASPVPLAARGKSVQTPAPAAPVLLMDNFTLGRSKVDVTLRLRRLSSSHAQIDISVVSSTPLPRPLRVNLYLNDEAYPVTIDDSEGSTPEIPLSKFENAQFRVEFEAGQSDFDSEE